MGETTEITEDTEAGQAFERVLIELSVYSVASVVASQILEL